MSVEYALTLLRSGAGNLAAYLAAHVLLCLVPAFFIAGAMTALIPKPGITRWLGRTTPRHVSYPAAAAAGSLLAVCSCTIIPLFAGIHRKGAGIGPAITFLFFAPAGNIMALAYTGGVLGAEFAFARLVLCLVFGIGIGMLMASFFARDDLRHDVQTDQMFADRAAIGSAASGMLVSLLALLVAGTLKVDLLSDVHYTLHVPLRSAQAWQSALLDWIPFDPAKGEEGVSVQGSLLIVLLLLIAAVARKGMEEITEGANRWTWLTLSLSSATLLLATLKITAVPGSIEVGITGRLAAGAIAIAAVLRFARRLPPQDWRAWLWESWRFVKQIFPLLVAGVFVVGMVREIIQPAWIESLAGGNTVLGNGIAVAFGVLMYFPTLVEVPVARMFLDLGMHPGPLLAYLMADPELSLQSILMVSAVIGRRKAFTYVGLVAMFSIAAGLLYGSWVDARATAIAATSFIAQ